MPFPIPMQDFHNQGWALTLLSLLLCVLGTLIIYAENVYNFVFPRFITRRWPIKLERNYRFLTCLMAFSSGGLLFTSLFRLLLEGQEYLDRATTNEGGNSNLDWELLVAYFGGATFYLAFNYILHILTSELVVHCSHGDEEHQGHHSDAHSHSHSTGGHHGHSHQEDHHDSHSMLLILLHTATTGAISTYTDADETTPLVKDSILHLVSSAVDNLKCKGYSLAELCVFHATTHENELHFCEVPELDVTEIIETELNPVSTRTSFHSKHDHHHHHVNLPKSRLFLIGLQTTLAITLHKFPEGFVTYVTSETDPQLGVLVFLLLLMHNFTEGFTMCLPLYYSFSESSHARYAKIKAVAILALLGGLSQPLGALLGAVFMAYNEDENVPGEVTLMFGYTLAVTAGFLTVVALQMFGLAVSFGGSLNLTMVWCFIGMAIIGFLGVYVS